MKKYTYTLLVGMILLPGFVYAQGIGSASNFGELVTLLSGYATRLIGLLVVIALVVFFWRIVGSIYKVGSDPKAVAQGKTLLLWGLVALFVMVSVWGLVAFVGNAIGIHNGKNAIIPQLEGHTK